MSSPRKVLRSSENDPPNNSKMPPKPPRSAFMCFTDAKKKEIISQHGIQKENDDILKIVAREWKSLSSSSRTHWEEEARNDKIRFVREKAAFKGPWAIPKRRAKKHPLAPKRPMSAFLKYSQTRRAKVKEDNPDMSNTDVSRLLGEMWRNASPRERAPYVDEEERERAIYKENIRKWRDDQARIDAASRTSHQRVQTFHHHQPPPIERPFRPSSFFDNLRVDSFEDTKRSTFRQQYSSNPPPYQHYRNPYSSTSELALRHGSEINEGDPLPLSRATSLLPSQLGEDDLTVDYGSRSSFFSDNLNLAFYSRYP